MTLLYYYCSKQICIIDKNKLLQTTLPAEDAGKFDTGQAVAIVGAAAGLHALVSTTGLPI